MFSPTNSSFEKHLGLSSPGPKRKPDALIQPHSIPDASSPRVTHQHWSEQGSSTPRRDLTYSRKRPPVTPPSGVGRSSLPPPLDAQPLGSWAPLAAGGISVVLQGRPPPCRSRPRLARPGLEPASFILLHLFVTVKCSPSRLEAHLLTLVRVSPSFALLPPYRPPDSSRLHALSCSFKTCDRPAGDPRPDKFPRLVRLVGASRTRRFVQRPPLHNGHYLGVRRHGGQPS